MPFSQTPTDSEIALQPLLPQLGPESRERPSADDEDQFNLDLRGNAVTGNASLFIDDVDTK